jgi:hypothetical protein
LIRIWIRVQHFRLNTDLDAIRIRIQGFDGQKMGKNFLGLKLQFTYP